MGQNYNLGTLLKEAIEKFNEEIKMNKNNNNNVENIDEITIKYKI